MRIVASLFCWFLGIVSSQHLYAQERKFTAGELAEDLAFLKRQVIGVHADPYTELKKPRFEALFRKIQSALADSMTVTDFYRLVKPVAASLADEHADIGMPEYLKRQMVFLPFSLSKQNGYYIVDAVLEPSQIKTGDTLTAIDQNSVQQLIDELASFTTGMADERKEKAFVQFGYLYGMAYPNDTIHSLKTNSNRSVTAKSIGLVSWINHLKNIYGTGINGPKISYRAEGRIGYITSSSFSVRSESEVVGFSRAIDSIFQLVQKDGVDKLVIDVSRNSGGNSAIGDLLIDHIYNKPYSSYQLNWRRSNEYLEVFRSYGDKNSRYEEMSPGEVLHYDSEKKVPLASAQKFRGKVFIAIGPGTFSSAMMFATTIKDNGIATLIGVVPKLGHPTHFGELYSCKLPNTRLPVRFGVKEWIRPAGKGVENTLRPDIILTDTAPATILSALQHLD